MRCWCLTTVLVLGFVLATGLGRAEDLKTLEIASQSGVHVFAVEIADTDAERSKGLMFRKHLAEGRGMLFDFGQEQEVAMWMKNTYISLDMLFIRGDGRILRIAADTEPQSTRIIPSGGPVRAVLEVIAGTARKLGIAPGDRVAFPDLRGELGGRLLGHGRACIEPETTAVVQVLPGHSAVW